MGAACGVVLAVAVFLPWYTTNLGPPFATGSASGWSATAFAKAALALGVLAAVCGVALSLEVLGRVRLAPEVGLALGGVLFVACALALGLVGYRAIAQPEPSGFLDLAIGIWLAVGAALGGMVAAVGHLSFSAGA